MQSVLQKFAPAKMKEMKGAAGRAVRGKDADRERRP
jgi:hypothetical protein